jgi:hypothetical protein
MRGVAAEYIERAIARLRSNETACNVAAVFAGEVTPSDLDGVRWRFVVADGNTRGTIDAGIAG